MPSPALTPEQVSQRLALSKRTVLRRFADGTLPGVKIGGEWRIDADVLEDFIKGSAS